MHHTLYASELKACHLDYKTDYYLPKLDYDAIYANKEPGGQYCTYLLLDLWWKSKNTYKFWAYDLQYAVRYVGSGTFSEPFQHISNTNSRHRPTNHKNDLFEKITKKYPERFKIVLVQDGLTKDECMALEAYIINYAIDFHGYEKTSRTTNSLNLSSFKQLLNKRRERIHEKLIATKILNTNLFYGNNLEGIIRR